MWLDRRKRLERLVVNLKLFAVKAYCLMIRSMPCRRLLIDSVGIVIGFLSIFLHAGQWKGVAQFALHIGKKRGRWLFIARYFIQKGKDMAWEVAGYETPLAPSEFAVVVGRELLDEFLLAGKGAILLGAHYGPSLYLHTLQGLSVDAKVLVAPWRMEYWDNVAAMGKTWLQRRMFDFLKSKSVTAGKEEKALVSHLRAGGAAFMDIDTPGPRAQEPTVTFLEVDIPPHYFPFELSIKYGAPVLFCLFEKDSQRPYRFRIVPCGAFSSPLEGFREYTAFIGNRILACPFLWSFVPHFSAIFGESSLPQSHRSNSTTAP